MKSILKLNSIAHIYNKHEFTNSLNMKLIQSKQKKKKRLSSIKNTVNSFSTVTKIMNENITKCAIYKLESNTYLENELIKPPREASVRQMHKKVNYILCTCTDRRTLHISHNLCRELYLKPRIAEVGK